MKNQEGDFLTYVAFVMMQDLNLGCEIVQAGILS